MYGVIFTARSAIRIKEPSSRIEIRMVLGMAWYSHY